MRDSDIVARLGGDEFVVVLTDLAAALDAASIAGGILQSLAEPYLVEGNTLNSSTSIGVSVFPQDGTDTDGLMKAADTAMYHAKAQGRNNVQFFTASMNADVQERLQLEHDLRVALRARKLSVHYQPKVRAMDSSVCGVEALARWQHPTLGMVSPVKFILVKSDLRHSRCRCGRIAPLIDALAVANGAHRGDAVVQTHGAQSRILSGTQHNAAAKVPHVFAYLPSLARHHDRASAVIKAETAKVGDVGFRSERATLKALILVKSDLRVGLCGCYDHRDCQGCLGECFHR